MKQGYKAILYLIVLTVLTPKFAEACKPQINWGSSVSFCQGNSFTLNAANPNATYLWSTGATTSSISVSTSGTYWVTVTNPCGTASDTIQVIVDKPVQVNLGPDRAFCAGSSTLLSVPFSPSATYLWQDGSTNNTFNATQSGTYYVSVTNACGTFRDTVVLTQDLPQTVSLGGDVVNCTNSPTVLQLPASITGTILWSDSTNGHSLSANHSGTYWVSVTNACGTQSDTIHVTFVNTGQLFSADSLIFCSNSNQTLTSPVPNANVLWSTGSTASTITITQPGTYWLKLVLPCGTFYDTVEYVQAAGISVNLGPDLDLCAGHTLTLNAGNPGSQYLWSTGSNSPVQNVSSAGTYWVGVNNGCGFVYDSINITVTPLPNPQFADTIYVCQGSSPTLDAGSWGPQSGYIWSNGITTRVNSSLSVGAQWVKAYNHCDTVTEHFYIKPQTVLNLNLGRDTTFCGGSINLYSHANPVGNQIEWSNGASTPNIQVGSTGTYWVKVTNACGTFSDTINLVINHAPYRIVPDTLYKCSGAGVWINTKANPNTTYLWNTGATSNRVFVTMPGKYWLDAYSVCDTLHDTVYVKDFNPPSFNLGPDTTFCSPASLTLNLANINADSVVWSTGARTTALVVVQSGTYWATAYNRCGSFTDTIHVIVNRRPVKKLQDTSFCSASSVVLNASQNQAISYLWSNGATTPSITVSSSGWYYVDITSICSTIRDSAYVNKVNPLPQIHLGSDTIFCAGTLTLNPGSFPNAIYSWQNGATTQTFKVKHSGTYFVTVTNSCNSVSDTINVLITGPPQMVLGNSVKFCGGSTLHLNAQNPGCTYVWNDGSTNQDLSVTQGGKYWVTISNACGTITDSINVIVEAPLNQFSLGGDTIICKGDSILLDTKSPGVYTKWKNGSNHSSIYVKQTGDYWVEVSNSCGSWDDTIHVEVQDIPRFSLGADTAICAQGGSLDLNGPQGMDSYLWSDGSQAQNLVITSAGTYWLTVTNKCFSYSDTIYVKADYPLDIDLGPDTTLCEGQILMLNAGMGHHNFKWDDNSQYSSKQITESGTYWIVARNSCGVFGDTINVIFEKPLNLPATDTTICDGDTAIFDLSGMKESYSWFDGSTAPIRKFTEKGQYALTVTNKCGEFTQMFDVNISHCECPFFVPNAFTPNGDGTNDEFKVGHSCDLSEYTIQIFNRWGQMVYESHDSQEGWDGTFAGQEVPEGIYTYKIQYLWYVYGLDRVREHTGTITIMR